MSQFSAEEKYLEACRELKMRRGLYPRWVVEGRMTQSDAARKIEIMGEIADDYDQLALKERLL